MNVTLEIRRFRYLLAVTVSEIRHGSCHLDGVSHYSFMNGEGWEVTHCGYEDAFNR